MNKVSRLFQPLLITPKNAQIKNQEITSKSQRLMTELGIVRPGASGSYHLLPLGERSLRKLSNLIDKCMKEIDAQKMQMPIINSGDLWKKTGRLEGSEIFRVVDRHDRLHVLCPTHEESVTALLASLAPLSYKQFPIRLYQIGSKFRDEVKPRFGLLRAREFIMKDLYTFDISEENAKVTYEAVQQSYHDLFSSLKVSFIKVMGATGTVGGTLSHEFHFVSPIGEDSLLTCDVCKYTANFELHENANNKCPKCGSPEIRQLNGIEVGHTFLLGKKYSKPLGAQFLATNGKPQDLQMGCFGLGVSRIIAASLEALSTEKELRWPLKIAPYLVCIIPPKKGSKEESVATPLAEDLYNRLSSLKGFWDEIMLDDRLQFTIGRRLFEAKRTGYPFVIVAGDSTVGETPKFELNDLVHDRVHHLSAEGVTDFLNKIDI